MNSINDIHALGTIQRSEYCRPFKLVQDGPGILPEAVGDGLTSVLRRLSASEEVNNQKPYREN
jgi:hypothetical protein